MGSIGSTRTASPVRWPRLLPLGPSPTVRRRRLPGSRSAYRGRATTVSLRPRRSLGVSVVRRRFGLAGSRQAARPIAAAQQRLERPQGEVGEVGRHAPVVSPRRATRAARAQPGRPRERVSSSQGRPSGRRAVDPAHIVRVDDLAGVARDQAAAAARVAAARRFSVLRHRRARSALSRSRPARRNSARCQRRVDAQLPGQGEHRGVPGRAS